MVHSSAQQLESSGILTHINGDEQPSHTGSAGRIILTSTQQQILHCLELGYSKQTAADYLGISAHTLDGELRHIYRSIGVHTMTAAVAKAIRDKLI